MLTLVTIIVMLIFEKMLLKTFAPRLPRIHLLALQEIGIDAASLAQHAEVAAEQRVHVQIVTIIECRNVERGSHMINTNNASKDRPPLVA